MSRASEARRRLHQARALGSLARHHEHGRPQRPFGYIVGRFHALHAGKGPQGRPPLRQLSTERRGCPVRVLLPTAQ